MGSKIQKEGGHTSEQETITAIIQSAYGNMSVTERRIADFVLNSPEKIMFSSVTQVAEELEIAQSSITRFCQTIGLRGYQELKIRIAQSSEQPARPGGDSEEEASLSKKLAQISANSILDASMSIDQEALDEAVKLLAAARKIVVFGLGESGPMAQLLKIKLMGQGLTADAHVDVHLQAISAAHVESSDVAIGISQEGSTKDIVSALRAARANGAKTICITGQGKSPITEVSDLKLVCVQRGITNILESFKSKASILYAIELLVISLSLYMTAQTAESQGKIWRTTESILDKLY
jgi:DNA-binding MurR/RpiR family transcriptional regulator